MTYIELINKHQIRFANDIKPGGSMNDTWNESMAPEPTTLSQLSSFTPPPYPHRRRHLHASASAAATSDNLITLRKLNVGLYSRDTSSQRKLPAFDGTRRIKNKLGKKNIGDTQLVNSPSLFIPMARHFFSLHAWHWFLCALSTMQRPVPAWHLK